MAEKKMTALEQLKLKAEAKLNAEDEKLSKHSIFDKNKKSEGNLIIQKNTVDNLNKDDFFLKPKKFIQKNIAIDEETKTMLDKLASKGNTVNASALFRHAVKELYDKYFNS